VAFDAQGGALALDPATVGLDWPAEFGPVLPLALKGELALWRDGEGWSLGSDALGIDAPGLRLDARFALGFQGDGTRPTLDLAADLDDFDVVAAKRFWLRTTMKPPVRQWLDAALVAGQARGARVALGGDLDHWPFRDGGGRFDARVSLEGVTLKFNDAWPAATGFHGEAVFDGPGMALTGMRATLLETVVSEATGAIVDFKTPWLDLAVRGGGDAGGLRTLVKQSPLYAPQRANIDALTVGGPAAVDLRLRLPLRKDLGERVVEGTLSLDNASVADARWKVGFEGLSGAIPFTDTGFLADAFAVARAQPRVGVAAVVARRPQPVGSARRHPAGAQR
jgi:uncharacterized protein YhdP